VAFTRRETVALAYMADESDAPAPIDLTALAHNLRKQAHGSAEREAYLEKLRKQVKSGEYQVDAEALARKLIEKAREDIDPDHLADAEK
jgi:anti-sigma28 factor (negative regulator of flagellin synthesis)